MTTTYQDAHDTNTQDEATDKIALAILDDLLSDNPTYGYDLEHAGKYSRQLTALVNARKNSLEAANRVLEAIKKRTGSELETLLRKREEASQKEQAAQADVVVVPELPAYAKLPEECLPRPYNPAPGDLYDWHDLWNDFKLSQVSPFLAKYIHYSYQCSPEGYVDFHVAGGLWVLSTVGGRRVYIDLSDPMYTPLAIAFVARTSLFAKSTTAYPGARLLKASGLGWFLGPDEITPQKLMFNMSGRLPSNYSELDDIGKERIRQRLAMSGQIGWYYDEFNQLIDAMTRPGPMSEFAGLLRKLDNCPDEYTYDTHKNGEQIIQKPYLALLASTTPANLRKHASKGKDFWNDGFWARLAFITPPPKSFRTRTMARGRVTIPDDLIEALSQWNGDLKVPDCEIEEKTDEEGKLTGRYEVFRGELEEKKVDFTDDAYNAYVRYREALRELIDADDNEDLDGSYSRLADKAVRIAALVASLENKSIINMDIWTLAQEVAEMFRRNLHEFYAQVNTGQAVENPLEDALIDFAKKRNGRVSSRDVLRNGPPSLRKLRSKGVDDLFSYLTKNGIFQCKKEEGKEYYLLCG